MASTRKLRKVGTSRVIVIPSDLAALCGLEIVAIASIAFREIDDTRWSASGVPASSTDYDGKKDTNGFTDTVTDGLLTLTRSV